MPQRNLTYTMRGSYGFKDRYFIEGSFGYNGSERFAKNNQMGFFPAGGLAWVVTSEPFMASTSRWLEFLKFRASYGQVGNDGIVSSPRFVYLPTIISMMGYKDPESGTGSGQLVARKVLSYANEKIKWEIAEQVNLELKQNYSKEF